MKRSVVLVMTLGLVTVAIAGALAQVTPKPSTAKPSTAATTTKPPASKAAAAAKPTAGVKLPAAIDAAFKASYPNATIKHVSKEMEGGKEAYEVESVDRGLARDLVYRADGTVVNIEEALTPADVPAPVAAAIKARYPKATITKREKLTTGTVVQYEMQITGANVKEVVLNPDGKFVSPK